MLAILKNVTLYGGQNYSFHDITFPQKSEELK